MTISSMIMEEKYMVNDILDFSKIESGKMELLPVDYSMGSLLNDLYNLIRIRAKDKNLKLVFDVDASIPRGYFGDDKRIRQILINLLTNAVKYTEKGSVTISVNCRKDGENAVVTFKNGGISSDQLYKTLKDGNKIQLFKNFRSRKNVLNITNAAHPSTGVRHYLLSHIIKQTGQRHIL